MSRNDLNTLYCGVDAGGTSCRAVVLSADGNISGWGYAAGANPTHAGWDQAGANMFAAVSMASADAGAHTNQIGSIFLGIAGVITEEDRAHALRLAQSWNLSSCCQCDVDHDIRIALEGGLAGRPGIAVIAGTGSSCYGRNAEGKSWQAGGWDRLLDDLGSGYDLAQKGMAAACQSADGRIAPSLLQDLFFGALSVNNVADFSSKVHRPGLARHEVAALAPLVLKAAQQGDVAATALVASGADELARMVEAVAHRLFPQQPCDVVLIGGLFEKSAQYRVPVESAIRARVPQVHFNTTQLRPAIGALSIAAAQAQHPFPLESLLRLSAQTKE